MSTPGLMEKDAQPAPATSHEQFVTPVVKDVEGRRLTRTMRSTDELQVLMDFYYAMVAPPAVEHGQGFFMYRSRPIWGNRTPASYSMEDGDEVEFIPEITPGMLVTPVLQDFRGRSFTRTMRRASRMQGLMDFYHAMVPAVARDGDGLFLYRGERVTGEQTAADLELEDWDRIYFVPRRRGEVVEEEMKEPASYSMEDGDEVESLPEITPGMLVSPVLQDFRGLSFTRTMQRASRMQGHVTLKVGDMKGRKLHCTMRTAERVQVLMEFYYATVPTAGKGRFLFDGRLLRDSEMTLAELEMEDGDEMYYLPALCGGDGKRGHKEACLF